MARRQDQKFLTENSFLKMLQKYLVEKKVKPQHVISIVRGLGCSYGDIATSNPQVPQILPAAQKQASGSSQANRAAFGESIKAALYHLNNPNQTRTYAKAASLTTSNVHQRNTKNSSTASNVTQSPGIVDNRQPGSTTTAGDGTQTQIQASSSNYPVDSAIVIGIKSAKTRHKATDSIRFALNEYSKRHMTAAEVISFMQMLVSQAILQPPNNPQFLAIEEKRNTATFQHRNILEDYCVYCKWLGLPPPYYFSHFFKDAQANCHCPLYKLYNCYIVQFHTIVDAVMQLANNMNVAKYCYYCRALGKPVDVYMSHIQQLSNDEVICPYFKALYP